MTLHNCDTPSPFTCILLQNCSTIVTKSSTHSFSLDSGVIYGRPLSLYMAMKETIKNLVGVSKISLAAEFEVVCWINWQTIPREN
jgi:hypothetical protein